MNVLIFTGGLHPSKKEFEACMLNFNKPDFVIAADSGFDTALSFGISCDLVVGDMDSIVQKDILKKLPKGNVKAFNTDKDFTDTELALFEAQEHGATNIILVGGDGGRLDHTLALLKLFKGSVYPNIWMCKEQVVFLLSEGIDSSIDFFLQKDDTCSVFSVFDTGCIHSNGLEWQLDGLKWNEGAYSVSNRAKNFSKPIHLEVIKGHFLLLVPFSVNLYKTQL